MSRETRPFLLLAGALAALAPAALAPAARAQSGGEAAAALAQAVRLRPATAPAAGRPSLLLSPDAVAPQAPGVARTAVDRPIGSGGLTGSLGFLCGLPPTPQVRGGAQALGEDDQGRFLGAKLRLPFH